jgi:hypothetical protein
VPSHLSVNALAQSCAFHSPFCGHLSVIRIFRQLADTLNAAMSFLFKIERVMGVNELPGRRCVIIPRVPEGSDCGIQARDVIQLRTRDGRTLDTHVHAVGWLNKSKGGSRIAIFLPSDVRTQDVPIGTEVRLMRNR